jgi:hypothetical protein
MAAAPVVPASPAPTPEPAGLSQGARIVNTFIAPSKTFTDLRRSASWWAPWLVGSVVVLLFFVVVGQKIGYRKVVETAIQASPKASERIDKLAPDQREKAIDQQTKGTQFFTYISPIFGLLITLIISAVLFATFTFGAGAEVKFKTVFALVTYAGLPGAIKYLLALLSVVAGISPDSFSLQNPVATNPGYFMNPADSPFLFSLASSVDIFLIWTLVLTAIGFTCVSKVKAGTAYAIVFGWWVVFSLIGAGIAAAFS